MMIFFDLITFSISNASLYNKKKLIKLKIIILIREFKNCVYYLLKWLNKKRKENINEINNIFKINNYYNDDFEKNQFMIIK